jgi:hypothetical protein
LLSLPIRCGRSLVAAALLRRWHCSPHAPRTVAGPRVPCT